MKDENVFEMNAPVSATGCEHLSGETHSIASPALEMPTSSGALRRSAFLEMILRQIPDGVVVCDRQGTIVLANRAAKRLAQMNPEGQSLDFAQSIWGELF